MKTLLFTLLLIPMMSFGQTAEDYSKKAFLQYQIDNYTKAIKLDPDDDDAYYNRGFVYAKSGNYKDAIADYSSVIKIDPDYADAYKNRGIAKENSGLPYCSDYKKACDLGIENACEWYYKQCK